MPRNSAARLCCILFKNYIKPQQRVDTLLQVDVVSYLKTTSNHNRRSMLSLRLNVVSYLKTTSNHNLSMVFLKAPFVVSYLKTTSNHNMHDARFPIIWLYLI